MDRNLRTVEFVHGCERRTVVIVVIVVHVNISIFVLIFCGQTLITQFCNLKRAHYISDAIEISETHVFILIFFHEACSQEVVYRHAFETVSPVYA